MKQLSIHIGLFVLTFINTSLAGAIWVSANVTELYSLDAIKAGLPYSVSLMFILTVHEFGHYFAARYHKVDASLPYYIPIPTLPWFLHFGTMGAVIRTRSLIPTNKAMFDIGVSGPVAGFVACFIVLAYGFANLPGQEYILNIHPDYFTDAYANQPVFLEFGNSLFFLGMKYLFASANAFIPPMSEVYHYPYLCVGWFGLLITSMNMIPVGQLDGGHVIYAMFGPLVHRTVSKIALGVVATFGVLGAANTFLFPEYHIAWMGWLFWALLLLGVLKIHHPPVPFFMKLDIKRRIVGYVSLVILFISFTPIPFYGVL